MSISRRGFLKGMLGVSGAIVAGPAICKAENLMKIWVPSQKIVTSMSFDTLSELAAILEQDREFSKDFVNAVARNNFKFNSDFDGDTISTYSINGVTYAARNAVTGRGSIVEITKTNIEDLVNARLCRRAQ